MHNNEGPGAAGVRTEQASKRRLARPFHLGAHHALCLRRLATYVLKQTRRIASQNGKADSPPSTVKRPRSVRVWSTCAIHSLPAVVDNAHWNGAVAISTAVSNCWTMVLATNLRTDVTCDDTAIPRTPTDSFSNAVNRPGTLARVNPDPCSRMMEEPMLRPVLPDQK